MKTAVKTKIRKTDFHPLLRIFVYLTVLVFTVLTLYPLFWLVISSLKTTTEFQRNMTGLPVNPTINNYPTAWRLAQFDTLFLNSLFFTVASTLLVILFSLMAGFAFAKIRSKATPFLHGSFVIGILLTLQSIMVPLFLMAVATNLYNTRLGVLIPYVGMGMPIGIYLCTEFIKSVPDSVVESARIDGASYLRIFAMIVAPMAKPVAVTLAILNVSGVWNEFMLVNILVSSDALRTLPVGILKFSGPLASDYGRMFAALTIGMVPMVVFYLIFRKQITQGVSAGAVKG
ncbi:MAG TPA: carbohydrate ABC transporter permease [Firmicutes bacterium]|jgi:raffinose/stachyose/melibiose transport system permease protein|nr:carbohydrate ABC transporter permease [Bacillota bacterium]